MGDSLAVAAAVAGVNAASRGLGAKPSVGAKLGDWFRTQQEAGKDLVAKIDFQDATVIAVIGAVMSYKEKKMALLNISFDNARREMVLHVMKLSESYFGTPCKVQEVEWMKLHKSVQKRLRYMVQLEAISLKKKRSNLNMTDGGDHD